MVETKCEMAKPSEKNFETKKFAGGLAVASFVFAGSQTVAHSSSSELRDPVVVDT